MTAVDVWFLIVSSSFVAPSQNPGMVGPFDTKMLCEEARITYLDKAAFCKHAVQRRDCPSTPAQIDRSTGTTLFCPVWVFEK